MRKQLVMKPSEFDMDKALDFLEEAFNSGVVKSHWSLWGALRGRRVSDKKHCEINRQFNYKVEDDEYIYTFDDHRDSLVQVIQNFLNTYEKTKDEVALYNFSFAFAPRSHWGNEHRVDIVLIDEEQ